MPALDDITIPDGKRFVLGAFAMVLLAVIVLRLPEGLIGLMLDCPLMNVVHQHSPNATDTVCLGRTRFW
jgi:hypothetical protein